MSFISTSGFSSFIPSISLSFISTSGFSSFICSGSFSFSSNIGFSSFTSTISLSFVSDSGFSSFVSSVSFSFTSNSGFCCFISSFSFSFSFISDIGFSSFISSLSFISVSGFSSFTSTISLSFISDTGFSSFISSVSFSFISDIGFSCFVSEIGFSSFISSVSLSFISETGVSPFISFSILFSFPFLPLNLLDFPSFFISSFSNGFESSFISMALFTSPFSSLIFLITESSFIGILDPSSIWTPIISSLSLASFSLVGSISFSPSFTSSSFSFSITLFGSFNSSFICVSSFWSGSCLIITFSTFCSILFPDWINFFCSSNSFNFCCLAICFCLSNLSSPLVIKLINLLYLNFCSLFFAFSFMVSKTFCLSLSSNIFIVSTTSFIFFSILFIFLYFSTELSFISFPFSSNFLLSPSSYISDMKYPVNLFKSFSFNSSGFFIITSSWTILSEVSMLSPLILSVLSFISFTMIP